MATNGTLITQPGSQCLPIHRGSQRYTGWGRAETRAGVRGRGGIAVTMKALLVYRSAGRVTCDRFAGPPGSYERKRTWAGQIIVQIKGQFKWTGGSGETFCPPWGSSLPPGRAHRKPSPAAGGNSLGLVYSGGLRTWGRQPGLANGTLFAQFSMPPYLRVFLVVFALAHFFLQAASFQQFFEAAQSRPDRLSVVNAHPKRHTFSPIAP